MISVKHGGNFDNTEKFLKRSINSNYLQIFKKYAQEGVDALASTTPVDSGLTASSWGYQIDISKQKTIITWTNSNIVNGVLIAVILQYGHGTRNGGYVQGRDYINPALRPIFDKITMEAWKEVTK